MAERTFTTEQAPQVIVFAMEGGSRCIAGIQEHLFPVTQKKFPEKFSV